VFDVLGGDIMPVPWWHWLHSGVQSIPRALYAWCWRRLLWLHLGHNNAGISYQYLFSCIFSCHHVFHRYFISLFFTL